MHPLLAPNKEKSSLSVILIEISPTGEIEMMFPFKDSKTRAQLATET